jgi:outer membrane autotransporter protein
VSVAVGEGEVDAGGLAADWISVRGGPYVHYRGEPWFADASLALGADGFDARRSALLGRAAESDPRHLALALDTRLGLDLDLAGWTVTPQAGLRVLGSWNRAATEIGGGSLAVQVDDQLRTALGARLGLGVAREVRVGSATLVPDLFVGLERTWLDEATLDARFIAGGERFTVTADLPTVRDVLHLGAGLAALLDEQRSAFVRYDGRWHADGRSHALVAGFTVRF